MKRTQFAFLALVGAISLISCNHTSSPTSSSSITTNKPLTIKSSKGDFFYNSINGESETTYGTAVILEYEEESHKITSVKRDEATINELGFKEVTEIVIESSWNGEQMHEKYLTGIDKSLERYSNKTYEEVYAEIRENITASYTSSNKKDVVFKINEEYKNKDNFIVTSGATLSSARLCIAVANAISNINMLDSLLTIGIDEFSPSGV